MPNATIALPGHFVANASHGNAIMDVIMYHSSHSLEYTLVHIFAIPVTWYLDWKLYVGFAMWGGTWVRRIVVGLEKTFWARNMFVFGLDLICLHGVQYHGAAGVVAGLALVGVQNILLIFFLNIPANVVKKGQFEATCVYADIGSLLAQSLVVFLAQLFAMLFYLFGLMHGCLNRKIDYPFWMVAFLFQIAAFFNRGKDSQVGDGWIVSQWREISECAEQYAFVEDKDGKPGTPFRVSQSNMRIRGFFGFLVNSFFRDIVCFSLPLLLMNSVDALNFVKDIVAVAFITNVDNMSEKVFRLTNLSENENTSEKFASRDMSRLMNVDSGEVQDLADTKRRDFRSFTSWIA